MSVTCPYCDRPARLVKGRVIYPHRPDLALRNFWQCSPCEAYVGCHANGTKDKPLGRLANAELRKAKQEAHAAFDPLWKSGEMKRRDAYAWLSSALGIAQQNTHIGMFDVDASRCRCGHCPKGPAMTIEYRLREEHGETVKCDSCDCPAPTSGFSWPPGDNGKRGAPQRMLCEFCSTTMASRYTEYPSLDLGDELRAEIWRAAACVFNMLRAEKDGRGAPGEGLS